MARRPSRDELARRLDDIEQDDEEQPSIEQLYADLVLLASGGDNEQARERLENAPDEVVAELVGDRDTEK